MIRILLTDVDKKRDNDILILDSETLHHLKVLRAEAGERIDMLDGQGRIYKGNLLSFDGKKAMIKVFEEAELKKGSPKLILACSLLSANRFDEVVDKAAEFGLDILVPMICKRTIAKVKEGELKDRWLRRARQICRSTGNPFVPEILPAMPFKEVVDRFSASEGVVFIPHLQAKPIHFLNEVYALKGKDLSYVVVLIGPEGDFTSEEVAYACQKGAREISLGKLVLRVETAAGFCAGLMSWLC